MPAGVVQLARREGHQASLRYPIETRKSASSVTSMSCSKAWAKIWRRVSVSSMTVPEHR